ncbi:hypothetical protein PAHAL_5G239400 [Panicum hallii]|uniref:Uncharacterized protein n=1 Tax=Panicum hallii TaxID=206008 RepID=A0A2S3HTU5_9POAL|nr:hypothetical protein PAHAL_5G239400 [Panicum hallii]
MSDGPCVHMLSRFSISQISGRFPGLKNGLINTLSENGITFLKMAQALLVMFFIQATYLAISVIRLRYFLYGWLDNSYILSDYRPMPFVTTQSPLYVQELLQITCALYNPVLISDD